MFKYNPFTANLDISGREAGPPGPGTDLGYTASTRELSSSSGANTVLPLFTTGNAGLTPASGGGTTNFLRADGTWAAPPGGGGGATTLPELTDVDGGTTPTDGFVLLGKGVTWFQSNTLRECKNVGNRDRYLVNQIGGNVSVDFSFVYGYLVQTFITADATILGSNYGQDNEFFWRIGNSSGSTFTLTWPAGWKFAGAKPTAIADDQELRLMVNCQGTNESDVLVTVLASSTDVQSQPAGVAGADQITNIMSLTQAEYDAIGSPDASTWYAITT